MGFVARGDPIVIQLYSEPLQKFRLAAEGHGAVQPPDASARARRTTLSTRCRSGMRRSRRTTRRPHGLSAARADPAADDHVSFLGLAERLAAPDPRPQPALCHARPRPRELGLADDDWVRVVSRNGAIKVQIKTMEGVNADTVWTWNAIGKRAGAWKLAPDAPEARKGFLLNHLISELLPGGRDGRAALERRSGHRAGGVVRPAGAHREMRGGRRRRREPQFAPSAAPAGSRSGAERQPLRRRRGKRGTLAMTDLPAAPSRSASASSSISTPASAATPARPIARNGTPAAISGAADRRQRLSGRAARRLVQPRLHLRGGRSGADGAHRAFPKNCLHCENAATASPSARPAPPTSAPRTASCWSTTTLHRLQAVLLGLPLWRARVRRGRRRDEEMHALHRQDLQREPAAKRSACPPASRPARRRRAISAISTIPNRTSRTSRASAAASI